MTDTALTDTQLAAVRRILDLSVTPHLATGQGTRKRPCTCAAAAAAAHCAAEADRDAYWTRRDVPGLLTRLCTVGSDRRAEDGADD